MPRPVRHDADVAAPRLTGDQRNAFMASFLGWTMDAFDYFLVVLVYADIATTFHHTKTDVAFLTTATLAMRPWVRCCSGYGPTGWAGGSR